MQRHHLFVALGAVIGALLAGLLFGFPAARDPYPLAGAADRLGSVTPDNPDSAGADDLQECMQTGRCELLDVVEVGGGTVDVISDLRIPAFPAVHFVTRYADSPPAVWSLRGEHGGTLLGINCAAENCIVALGVTGELTVVLDLRIRDGVVMGRIEGAAMTHAADVLAVDLDRDGILDVALHERSLSSDSGSTSYYYRTLHNDDGFLGTSGCSPPSEAQVGPPRALLTKTCPGQ